MSSQYFTVTKKQELNALLFGIAWNTPLGDCGYSYIPVSQRKINTQF